MQTAAYCGPVSRSVTVSVGVSVFGVTGPHSVNPGVKINEKYSSEGTTAFRHAWHLRIFQQDIAPAHCAKETIDVLSIYWNTSFLSSRKHSGRLTVRILIRLTIESGQYFEESVQGEGQQYLWAAPVYPDCLGWTWPAYYWQGDQAVAHLPMSLRRGQMWPLWAQTLNTSSAQNDRLHKRFTFCKNLSGINDFTLTYLMGCR